MSVTLLQIQEATTTGKDRNEQKQKRKLKKN